MSGVLVEDGKGRWRQDVDGFGQLAGWAPAFAHYDLKLVHNPNHAMRERMFWTVLANVLSFGVIERMYGDPRYARFIWKSCGLEIIPTSIPTSKGQGHALYQYNRVVKRFKLP